MKARYLTLLALLVVLTYGHITYFLYELIAAPSSTLTWGWAVSWGVLMIMGLVHNVIAIRNPRKMVEEPMRIILS